MKKSPLYLVHVWGYQTYARFLELKENLLKEGILKHNIFITGNTVIDALFIAVDKVKSNLPIIHELLDHVRNADIAKFLC